MRKISKKALAIVAAAITILILAMSPVLTATAQGGYNLNLPVIAKDSGPGGQMPNPTSTPLPTMAPPNPTSTPEPSPTPEMGGVWMLPSGNRCGPYDTPTGTIPALVYLPDDQCVRVANNTGLAAQFSWVYKQVVFDHLVSGNNNALGWFSDGGSATILFDGELSPRPECTNVSAFKVSAEKPFIVQINSGSFGQGAYFDTGANTPSCTPPAP